MMPSNYHTHSTFCDGKDTPEEMVIKAIESGCPRIGFSGHSYTEFDQDYCMSKQGTKEYIDTIKKLKIKYRDKIDIILGVEQDYFSEESTIDYEYVIGSVHYVKKCNRYLSIDNNKNLQVEAVNKYYGGDYYSFIEDYYSLVGDVYNKTHCDIIGHFDLVTKFNEDGSLFDINHPRYITAMQNALEKLLKTPAIFEVNSGAIARGYRTTPYPEKSILEQIQRAGKRVIYTSDCHNKDYLLLGLPLQDIKL